MASPPISGNPPEPGLTRAKLLVPVLALVILFVAALGYPLFRPALVGGSAVVAAEIAPAEPTPDAIRLDTERVSAEVPALAKALDLALETGELHLLDRDSATRIAAWLETTHGVAEDAIVVEWKDAFFHIGVESA